MFNISKYYTFFISIIIYDVYKNTLYRKKTHKNFVYLYLYYLVKIENENEK